MKEEKKTMLRSIGFKKEIDNVENNLCAICKSDKVKPEDFRDDLSRREFEISGMCQSCMDKIFND